MDAKRLTRIIEGFVRDKGGVWSHDDWVLFLDAARKAGFDESEESFGKMLEDEKIRYAEWKANPEETRSEEKTPAKHEEMTKEKKKNKKKDEAKSTAMTKESIIIFGQKVKDYILSAADKIRLHILPDIRQKTEDHIPEMRKTEEQENFKEGNQNHDDLKNDVDESRDNFFDIGLGKELTEIKEISGVKAKEFMKTGIDGFDTLLAKGIPRGISVLLAGGPGCGKTTFGLHLLARSAMKGENCLYMSFEEKEEQLLSHMANFGFSVKESLAKGNLVVKRYDPFLISQNVEALLAEARGELLIKLDKIEQFIPKDFMPDIIVLDSLSAVSAAFAGRKDGYRIYIEQLFRSLEKTGATSFLITETNTNLKSYESKVEEFLADGVISFYNIRKGNSRVKALEIIKIRGVNFKKKIVPFDILEGVGIEVYPMEEVFTRKI